MKTKIQKFDLPEYWAGALVNGDWDNLQPSEIDEIERFLSDNDLEGCMCECGGESFFAHSNDANDANDIGGNCLAYSFLVHVPETVTKEDMEDDNLVGGIDY